MIKKILNFTIIFFFNTSIDYRIRKFLFKKDPVIEMKPWNSKSVISDLFLWRAGDN